MYNGYSISLVGACKMLNQMIADSLRTQLEDKTKDDLRRMCKSILDDVLSFYNL